MLRNKKLLSPISSFATKHLAFNFPRNITIKNTADTINPTAYDVVVIGGGHAGCEAAYGLS